MCPKALIYNLLNHKYINVLTFKKEEDKKEKKEKTNIGSYLKKSFTTFPWIK